VLSDDFSPVEYLTAQVLRRSLGQTFDMDGQEMAAIADQQRRYGPRHIGTGGRVRAQQFIEAELGGMVQELIPQTFRHWVDGQEIELTNYIGRMFASEPRRVVLAAPNNAAASVGILLELARTLLNTPTPPRVGVDIVTFDGSFERGTSLGAAHFGQQLAAVYGDTPPVGAVVLTGACEERFDLERQIVDLARRPAVVSPDSPDEACAGETLDAVGRSLLAYVTGLGKA
jgi:hypothetical protein